MSDFTARQLTTATVNPLLSSFENARIQASDFYHPYFRFNSEKTFRNCEFMGPCNVVLEGNTQMPRMRVRDCDFVIVDPGKGMKGVTGFENCNFIDCAFYRVTFFMTASSARDLKRQILETGKSDGPEAMNIISDGRYGSI